MSECKNEINMLTKFYISSVLKYYMYIIKLINVEI